MPFKPQFSLRTIVFSFLLVGVGVGWYVLDLEAKRGVKIPVPHPLGVSDEYEVPEYLTEFRDRKLIREITNQFESRLERQESERISALTKDLSRFLPHDESDLHLLSQYQTQFINAARINLNSNDFRTAVASAFILDHSGEADALKQIEARLLNRTPKDLDSIHHLFRYFQANRLLSNPSIVELLKQLADEEGKSQATAARILYEAGLDRQTYVILQEESLEGVYEKRAIEWLVRNAPSPEILDYAFTKLKDDFSGRYGNHELVNLILEQRHQSAELNQLANQVEELLHRFLSENNKEYWSTIYHWDALANYGSLTSKDFVTEVLRDKSQRGRWAMAIKTMIQFGELDEARERIAKLPIYADTTREFFELYQRLHGRESTIELCRQAATRNQCPEALNHLCQMYQGTGNANAIRLVRELKIETQDPDLEEGIQLLHQLGDLEIAEVFERIPRQQFAREPNLRFLRQWFSRHMSRSRVIYTINSLFAPEPPLDTRTVLERPAYPLDHYLWDTWSRIEPSTDTPVEFVLFALAHSGHGHLAYWEACHPEGIVGEIAELANTTATDFVVQAHNVSGSSRYEFEIVVNHRLYRFSIGEGPNGSDERYDVGAIIEIMNSIAIRQGLKKRFIAYPTPWDNGFYLVMHVDRKTVKQLELELGLEPLPGSHFYLNH